MEAHIKRISAQDTYGLRSNILRPGQPIENCQYPHDRDETTFHLGAFHSDKLNCIASFYLENHPQIEPSVQYRLRGMATIEDARGKGLASVILKSSFQILKQNQAEILWCNARTSALGFYEKLGFVKFGNEFEIKGIGPHFVMVKSIK